MRRQTLHILHTDPTATPDGLRADPCLRSPAGTPFIIFPTGNTSSPQTAAAMKNEIDVCLNRIGICSVPGRLAADENTPRA